MAISQTGHSAPQRDWAPPTTVERALLDAVSRADWKGYARVLAAEDLFVHVVKEERDRLGDGCPLPLHAAPDGGRCHVVRTRGLLADEGATVACRTAFPPPAEKTAEGARPGLLVNPGTPVAAYFPFDAKQWRRWQKLARKTPSRGHDDDILLTTRSGPRHGPLAHGLACGAHMPVHNQVLWNEVGGVYDDYVWDVGVLRESWGVTCREGWLTQLGVLLRGENSPPQPEFALAVRNAVAGNDPGRPVDPRTWREAALARAREEGRGERFGAGVQKVIGRIIRYEDRFRADGLLPPGGRVVSALAYDYGRAVSFARWGASARYADRAEAEQAVIRAGEQSRRAYASWKEFSAGYVLGRALRFDGDAFGHMYLSALRPHRVLTGHPDSPWLSIPFGNP